MIINVFGLPGSGKTTLLAKIAKEQQFKIDCGMSKYEAVYTNVNVSIPGVRLIKWEYIGIYDYKNALILIDEIGLNAHSRDFSKFPKHLIEWFCTHRHEGCDLWYFSQYYNQADKVIREVTEKVYYIERCKIFRFRSKYTLIPKTIIIPKETGDITEGYRLPGFIERIWLSKRFTRKKYYSLFDSWECYTHRKPARYTVVPGDPSRFAMIVRKILDRLKRK